MTAHELARKLLEGPDVMITVRGYEGGVNEVTGVCAPDKLALNKYTEWYYGRHEYLEGKKLREGFGYTVVDAIHIVG